MTLDHEIDAQPLEPAEPAVDLDLVRLYFDEIGRVRLLSAKQEVALARRIEDARRELLGLLLEIPVARRSLAEIGKGLGRGEVTAETVIVLPEGGEPDAAEVRRVSGALVGLARSARAREKVAA